MMSFEGRGLAVARRALRSLSVQVKQAIMHLALGGLQYLHELTIELVPGTGAELPVWRHQIDENRCHN